MNKNTKDRIRKFSKERDRDKFHTPANLAKSISIEANELLELFRFKNTEESINFINNNNILNYDYL